MLSSDPVADSARLPPPPDLISVENLPLPDADAEAAAPTALLLWAPPPEPYISNSAPLPLPLPASMATERRREARPAERAVLVDLVVLLMGWWCEEGVWWLSSA